MECIDTFPQNNPLENRTSTESMIITQHHPEQDMTGGESQDAGLSDAEKELSHRTNDHENTVKDLDEDSVEDVDQNLSMRRGKLIILSDDDDDDPMSVPVTSHPSQKEYGFSRSKMIDFGSDMENDDDDDDVLFCKKIDTEKVKVVYNPNIFDTELSDDDLPPQREEPNLTPSSPLESEKAIPPKGKKQVKKARPSSVKAQQELRDIHSESQRMLRESRVSLPYHRPKQRTLTEFLARRKQTMPPKILNNQSLKMTMRNMEILKLLEEKKKQVAEFYKSDSDSEDPEDRDWTPDETETPTETPTETEKEMNPCTATEHLVSDFTFPDLNTGLSECESSAREVESLEGCPQSHPLKNHTTAVSSEDEGLGCSEKSILNELSTPLDTPQLVDLEGSLPVIKPSEDEKMENIFTETLVNTEGLCDREETLSEEPLADVREELHNFDTISNTGIAKLSTPKLNLLASKLPKEEMKRIMSLTPKLNSGKKDNFIDLDECSPSQNPGMIAFMKRFMKHTDAKQKPIEKQQVNLNIVSKEDDGAGGEQLVSSTVSVTVDGKEEQPLKEGVRGSRINAFKAALKVKIKEQREIHRLKRVQEKQFMETEEIPEDYLDDNLPNEEADLTDKSETDYETESEPEENDVLITDNKREKNTYVDDEADEEEVEEEDEDDGGDVEPENDDVEEATGPPSDTDNENDTSEPTKERKRIIKLTDDDSEEEEEEEEEEKENREGNLTLNWDETQDLSEANPVAISRSNTDDLSISFTSKKGETLDKDTSVASFDSSFELYGSVIAGHQPRGGMKLNSENSLPSLTKNKSSSFGSSSSTYSRKHQELSLPAEDSVDIFNHEATCVSPAGPDLNFSSLDCTQQPHEANKEAEPFAKLQLDFSRIDATQDKDELIGLCSGQFSGQGEAHTPMRELCEEEQVSSTQEISDLLGLCSGRFAGPKEGQNTHLNTTQGGPKTLPVSQDDADNDDELLGLCTAKFTMSADSQTETYPEEREAKKTAKENQAPASSQMIIYSSEDDDSMDIKTRTVRRKKRKRPIEFSDDEDAQEPLAFDDEENLVSATVFTGFKDNARGGIRADFLENEAELSGSDFNSGDEADDSGDDALEEEEGDKEHFDSNELRDQVGKAHLRSLLDTDKREVRLLQEMYLEDGELHGEGRSRQFRWKNLDKRMEDDEKRAFSDEDGSDDNNIENDTQWRKLKLEREKFIQEQKVKIADEAAELYELKSWPGLKLNLPKDESEDSKLPPPPVLPLQVKTDSNFLFKKQRGSFLNRDKSTLARIAEFTKDRRDVVGGAKQGGNFVFHKISTDELEDDEEEKVDVSKRRRDSLPPKKARIDKFAFSREDSQSSNSIIFKYL